MSNCEHINHFPLPDSKKVMAYLAKAWKDYLKTVPLNFGYQSLIQCKWPILKVLLLNLRMMIKVSPGLFLILSLKLDSYKKLKIKTLKECRRKEQKLLLEFKCLKLYLAAADSNSHNVALAFNVAIEMNIQNLIL